MLDQFVSEGVLFPCRFASPLVIVHKKWRKSYGHWLTGKLICNWNQPLFSYLISPLCFKDLGQHFYAKVDNLRGYHQLSLTEDSSKVTAIITPWAFSCVPICYIYGTNGEDQARMAHEILLDYYSNGAIVCVDDTVIYGSTVEASNRSWIKSLAFKLRLKPSKCVSEWILSSIWDIC